MINHSALGDLTDANISLLLKTLASVNASVDDELMLYPIEWVIPITVVYGIIFVSGIIGNVSTCVVISRNKSLHTVTNFYLFSIAISDLLLLISGLPPEMYRIWSPETYVFGEAFCVLQGFAAETSANATVLAITAFTVERYLAICHPFFSHTMSKLSRAIRYIIAIWIVALCLAAPQAIQFGVEYEYGNGTETSRCTVVPNDYFQHAFEISTFLIFVGPMTLITVLYILIAVKLGKSRALGSIKRPSLATTNGDGVSRASRAAAAQNRVIKMLVAVVVAFFICWAPFHAQRLLAVYLASASREAQVMSVSVYRALMYISGVLYFLSTTINPVLYHIMSNKFRQAFKSTFYQMCGKAAPPETRGRTYSVLSRCPPSLRNYQRSVSDGVQHSQQVPLNQTPDNKINNLQQANNKNNSFRPRMLSQSSQTTVLTTISKSLSDGSRINANTTRKPVNGRNRRGTGRPPENKKYLGRFSGLINIFHKPHARDDGMYLRNCSVETANTISNSSLQDLEEIEFSSTDLVRYMEEINEDLT